MFTTRFWGATTVLLCALLSQHCQSRLNALEEESPAEAPPRAGWQPPTSEALTQPLSYALSPPRTTAAHQPKVPLTAPSLPLLPGVSLLTTFAGSSPSTGVRPTASITPSRNIFTQDSYRPFAASTGELVRFQQVGSQWQAVVQSDPSAYTPQRTLSVVSPSDIGTQLSWLQTQDVWTSRARIHLLNTAQSPYSPCVYLGRVGLLGGSPFDTAVDEKLVELNNQETGPGGRGREWVRGQNIQLPSNKDEETYHWDIPEGYIFFTYYKLENNTDDASIAIKQNRDDYSRVDKRSSRKYTENTGQVGVAGLNKVVQPGVEGNFNRASGYEDAEEASRNNAALEIKVSRKNKASGWTLPGGKRGSDVSRLEIQVLLCLEKRG